MTTSTNEVEVQSKKGGSFTKAASATLAGVLAVGMVPAVAFAEAADDVQEDEGISSLAVTPAQAFTNGAVAAAIWTGQNTAGAPTAGGIEINATGAAVEVIPVTVTPENATTVAVYDTSANKPKDGYTFEYYAAGEDGKKTGNALSSVVDPGKYLAVVKATAGDYAGGEIALPFTVKAQSLGTLTVKELNANADPDAYFMYTGKKLNLVATCSGTGLVAGRDYSVKYIKENSSVGSAGVDVIEAGKYYAVATGLGVYAGQTVTSGAIDVQKFNLSAANVIVGDSTSNVAPAHPTKVVSTATNYVGTELDPSLVDLTLSDYPASGPNAWVKNGAYEVTATAANLPNTNTPNPGIANTQTDIAVNKVGALATFKYGNAALADMTINAGAGESFNASKLSAYNGTKKIEASGSGVPTFDPESSTNVSVTGGPTGGTDTPQEKLEAGTAGTYTLTVTVTDTTYTVGGSQTVTVTVVSGDVDADASAYFVYQNASNVKTPFTSITLPYLAAGYTVTTTGSIAPGAAGFDTVVEDTEGHKLILGTDYNVVAKDADGNTVAGNLTAPGTYTISITSSTYEISGTNSVTVTINKINFADLRIADASSKAALKFIDTTSNVANTAVEVQYNTGVKDASGKDVYAALPTDISAEWEAQNADGEWVDATFPISANTIGAYRAVVKPNTTFGASVADYQSSTGTIVGINAMPASSATQFGDVQSDAWYALPIAKATLETAPGVVSSTAFMSGYAGTKLFGPVDSMTRGQVACILYNMARNGATPISPDAIGGIGGDNSASFSSFADVDPKAYYAKPVAWAKQNQVVNGYAGTDFFAPDQAITREQFACMLMNYAKAIQSPTLKGITNDAMNALPDAGAVSGYAKEAVAWAVQNKILGNGGVIDPANIITRAEAAAMGSNFLAVNNA